MEGRVGRDGGNERGERREAGMDRMLGRWGGVDGVVGVGGWGT